MKPLTSSPSSSSSCFCSSSTDNNSHICYSSLKFHPINHRLVYFPRTKLPSLHFVSFHSNLLLLPVLSSSEADLELADALNHESYESKTVHVKFQLKRQCSFGEQFAIVGDDPILGIWDPDKAIPLSWSEDHVWNLELDVPIGKSIKFKFVLKQISGSIVWQPGPDRILETWDTMNTIVVWEDWEDSSFQKLTEEEQISSENMDPVTYSETKLVAEDFILQNASDSKEQKEQISFEGEAIFAVADNIRSSNEEPAVVQNHQVLEEEREGDSNEDAVIFEKILENNGRTVEVTNSENINVGEDLMNEKGYPVLVPGLPIEPVNCCETKDADEGEKSTSTIGSSVGANEVEIHNFSELEEKHDVEVGQHDSVPIQVFSGMEQREEACEDNQQKPNKVIENDLQWGRRTIRWLLSNLGLL